jgi:hypothetical protein
MTTRPYPLRIPDGVLRLAELRSQEERTDKTTALRQWLYAAAEDYALQQLAAGRLTLSHVAELLDLSVYDLQRKAQARGLALGATAEQYHQARNTTQHLQPRRPPRRAHRAKSSPLPDASGGPQP